MNEEPVRRHSFLHHAARRLVWPFLVVSSAAILAFGFSLGREVLFFNISYAWIVAWLFLLEKLLPYRAGWRLSDGQLGPDLSHTVLNKGLVQLLIVQLIGLGILGGDGTSMAGSLALPFQVAIGLVIVEIGLYSAHRLGHEWALLWRFHAVHHSSKKLWLINTGRFHFVDSLVSVVASLPFLLLLGISTDAIVWISAITAYIGILTHCNVDMECGWLNYIFNTPNLHRWHHSADRAECDHNYAENMMLWDILLGTFLYKKGPGIAEAGIAEKMPRKFFAQLAVPFIWNRYQLAADPVSPDIL